MKNPIFFSFFSLALGFIFLTKACPPAATDQGVTYNEDCHEDRKTLATFENKRGIVKQLGEIFVLLSSKEESTRYLPCNLEERFQKEGLKLNFSGKEKEVFPHERWPATPFVLTAIEVEE